MNKHRIVHLAALTGLVGALLSPSAAEAKKPPQDRIEVCHNQGKNRWKLLSLPGPGAAGVLGHGGGVPLGVVPGEIGMKFNASCVPVPFTTVTVAGPERSPDEVASINTALDAFSATSGVPIRYVGSEDFQSLVDTTVDTGQPPTVTDPISGGTVSVDILTLPVPRVVGALADAGAAVPAAAATASAAGAGWSDDWLDYGTVDGTLYAVPVKSDLKSLVWYKPSTFVDPSGAPYTVPTTWDELVALTDTIISDGKTPWCVGIESGAATGWNYTDWIELRVLGSQPASVYDGWITNDVAFTDTRIRTAWNEVADLWQTPGAVFEGLSTAPAPGVGIAQTSFFDSILNLGFADECLMHRQASFLSEILPTEILDTMETFAFPGDSASESPVMGSGLFAAALRSDVEVSLVHEYLASADYADARRAQQPGFLSAVAGQDLSGATPLTVAFVEQLQDATVFRFDASDVMPAEIGADVFAGFWGEGTRAVIGDGNTATYDYRPDGPLFDFDGTTVDQATQTIADLFCTVVPAGAAC